MWAWVAEATGLTPLPGWPPGTRLILRKERPHPGAQLRITDADGLPITGFLTNTTHGGPGRQLADLELRHRRHARVEDLPRGEGHRTAQPAQPRHRPEPNLGRHHRTGPGPARWCTRLALPTTAAGYEPKRMRLRILATTGRLAHTARRHVLHIDSTWPRAQTITTAHTRLRALPVP